MLNQKLQFKNLKKGKNRLSISGKISEICLHGIVVYFEHFESCISCVLHSKTKIDPKDCFLSKGRVLLREEDQKKTQ